MHPCGIDSKYLVREIFGFGLHEVANTAMHGGQPFSLILPQLCGRGCPDSYFVEDHCDGLN